MKRTIQAVMLVSLLLFSVRLSAEDIYPDQPSHAREKPQFREAVLIDFTSLNDPGVDSRTRFTNWRIILKGHSSRGMSRNRSGIQMVEVNSAQVGKDPETGETFSIDRAVGICVSFADSPYPDQASIEPVFDGKLPFTPGENSGIISNVGIIKEVSVVVRGLRHRHTLELHLKDGYGRQRKMGFGNFHFNAWRRLVWKNPIYFQDNRRQDATGLQLFPYPSGKVLFDSLVVYKPYPDTRGELVFYITEIRIVYEPMDSPALGLPRK